MTVKDTNSTNWLELIYDNGDLRITIDEYLADGYKINAIKEFKLFCNGVVSSIPEWANKPTLRRCKDTIDIYANRLNITTKMELLKKTIRDYYNSKGDYLSLHTNTDTDFINEAYDKMISSAEWKPTAKILKDMNNLYNKYKLTKRNLKNV